MNFRVRTHRLQAGDRVGDVYEVLDPDKTVRAEVWTHWGFNCLRWQVKLPDGHWADLLYSAPDWETNPVPTRSGHPILFPFPGRLREGRFVHEGKVYELPRNDLTGYHAIHGFAARSRWRWVEGFECDHFASVVGEFYLSHDLPEALPLWPLDCAAIVTYHVRRDRLRVYAVVRCIGMETLPFGLGFHPYFQLPGVNGADIGSYVLQIHLPQVWETVDLLPTGRKLPAEGALNFRHPRPIGSLQLDHVYTGVPPPTGPLPPYELLPEQSLVEVAVLSHPQARGRLRVLVGPDFRELVVYTPPHRRAIALEPYTCAPDAANLASRGVDAGWKVLSRWNEWVSMVEYRWEPAGD